MENRPEKDYAKELAKYVKQIRFKIIKRKDFANELKKMTKEMGLGTIPRKLNASLQMKENLI